MELVRVVLDTNVVVSAHLNADGFERHVLDLVLARKLQLAVSAPILAEYEGVLLRRKFGLLPKLGTALLRNIRRAWKFVHPPTKQAIAHDPADNRFLECAENRMLRLPGYWK